jgi:hypothetical protein
VAEKDDASKLHLIKESLDIDDLEKLHGKLFRDNSSMDKEVYYIHVAKNIFAKIIKDEELFHVAEYETLAYYRVSSEKLFLSERGSS